MQNPAPTVPNGARLVPDDFELLKEIGRGDNAAFRVLIERHGRYLYGIAHALSGDPADAEDLIQETFAAVLKSRFRGEASVRTWLVQILVRRAGMLRRWRSRHPVYRMDAELADGDAVGATNANEAVQTDARLDLSTMLERLSPEHRAVIVLRELEGLSYEQIATVLRIPRGTVESSLHRAREQLRGLFRGYL